MRGGLSGRGERRRQPHLFALLAAPMLLLLEELEVELFLLLLVELLELLLQEGDGSEASQRVSAGDGGMTFFVPPGETVARILSPFCQFTVKFSAEEEPCGTV